MNSRNFTRVRYTAGASILFGNEMVFCNTDNLSLCGMCLKTGQEIPLNIPVQVTVYNSNMTSFKVTAKVVWSEENEVGVKIDNLEVNSFVQLFNIVTDISQDQGIVMQETFKMLKYIN